MPASYTERLTADFWDWPDRGRSRGEEVPLEGREPLAIRGFAARYQDPARRPIRDLELKSNAIEGNVAELDSGFIYDMKMMIPKKAISRRGRAEHLRARARITSHFRAEICARFGRSEGAKPQD